MGSQHGGYPPKNVKFWILGAPRRSKMCCSILNTILNDVKYLGEGLQKISWTLLMIKDRQNGKNDLWGIFHNWWSLGRPIIPKKGVFEVWDWTSRTSKNFSIALRIMLFVFASFLVIISIHWNKRDVLTTHRSDPIHPNVSYRRFFSLNQLSQWAHKMGGTPQKMQIFEFLVLPRGRKCVVVYRTRF